MTRTKRQTTSTATQYPPTHQEDPLMGAAEVARQLGKSPQTIKRWVEDGLIQAVRNPKGGWLVRQSEVNSLLTGSALSQQVS